HLDVRAAARTGTGDDVGNSVAVHVAERDPYSARESGGVRVEARLSTVRMQNADDRRRSFAGRDHDILCGCCSWPEPKNKEPHETRTKPLEHLPSQPTRRRWAEPARPVGATN